MVTLAEEESVCLVSQCLLHRSANADHETPTGALASPVPAYPGLTIPGAATVSSSDASSASSTRTGTACICICWLA